MPAHREPTLPHATFHGPIHPLAAKLAEAAAAMLAWLALDPEAAPDATIAAMTAFAADCTPETAFLVLLRAGPAWPERARLALLRAHMRHAALEWAPRRLRCNAIALGVPPPAGLVAGGVAAAPATAADIARVGLALLRWPSITGQTIRLAA